MCKYVQINSKQDNERSRTPLIQYVAILTLLRAAVEIKEELLSLLLVIIKYAKSTFYATKTGNVEKCTCELELNS